MITKNTLIKDWTENIKDLIEEVVYYNFKDKKCELLNVDNVIDEVQERIWQDIDGSQEVIYTGQAKEVCDALYIDIFDNDPQTGERYNSWSHAAFSAIYELIQNEINIEKMIEQAVIEIINENE